MISNKTFPKIQFTIEIAQVRPIFGRKSDITENIWKQSTEQERQMVPDKIWSIRTVVFIITMF